MQFMHSTTVSPPSSTNTKSKESHKTVISPLTLYSQPIGASKRSHMARIPRKAEAGRFGFAQESGVVGALAAHPMGEI
jgi:hypothetical protein